MRFTPDDISDLRRGEIFVFGSNLAGIHGGGAAKLAFDKFGAKWGVGEGPTGQCYALPTKDEQIETRDLRNIQLSVTAFVRYAKQNLDNWFLVTEVGCGLAGLKHRDIACLFRNTGQLPWNIVLPEKFVTNIVWDNPA